VQVDPAVVGVGLRVESQGSSPERTGLVVRPAYSAWGRRRGGMDEGQGAAADVQQLVPIEVW
jgi:hypothetical protein